jgi:peptidyl-prolyl cis-trans isomerase D
MGVVMTVLAGSFAVWGINDIFHGYANASLAKIGNVEITSDQFRQSYNDRLQQLGRQIGRPIPPEQAAALGVDHQVLGELVIGAGLDQMARRMRLGIPDAQIARTITGDPHFQTPTGQFDRARFEDFLRSVGYTEQRFVDEQRRLVPRRELTDTISGSVPTPKVLLEAINQYQNQQRSIQYLVLGPAQAGDIPPPTDAELSKYFEARKILFRAPEYRKIVVVSAMPEQIAKSIEVSDADVKHAYEEDTSTYTTPERRHVEQIIFPTMADAQAASARIKSGTTFAAIAAERKLKETDIDLGTVPKGSIIDPAVANAAFALKQGEVSAPIQGQFGAVIITVLSIEPKVVKPFAVVAPFIRSDLALQRAKAKVQEFHDKIEDARAGGSSLEEAAHKLNLPVTTIEAVDRSGRDPSGKLLTNVPGNVVGAAFASDVGVDNDPVAATGGYVWYSVAAITPARDRDLKEVKSQVEQSWRDDQIATRLKDKAAALLDKLNKGDPFDALAKAEGVKLESAADLKRGVASPGLSARVIDAVFRTAKDKFGSTLGLTPSQWFVFRVTDVKTPTLDPKSAEAKKLEQLLQRQMGDDVFNQYVGWLESYLGTNINQAMLAQAVGNAAPDFN